MKKFILAVYILITLSIHAGAKPSSGYFENWNFITINKKLPKHEKTSLEVSFVPISQFTGDKTGFDMLLIQTGVNHKLNKKWSVYAGHGFLSRHLAGKDQNWLIGAVNYTTKLGKTDWTLTHRSRLEEVLISDSDQNTQRYRGRVRLSHPIAHREDLSAFVSNEVFINLNDNNINQPIGFEQDWFILGINKKLNKNVSIEGGYFLDYINIPHSTSSTYNHAIYSAVNINF